MTYYALFRYACVSKSNCTTFRHVISLNRISSSKRNVSNTQDDGNEHALKVEIEDEPVNEDFINERRNKSLLNAKHYAIINKKVIPLNEYDQIKGSIGKFRKHRAFYGESSGISPAHCWPTKREMEYQKAWEKQTFPDDIHTMIKKHRIAEQEEYETIKLQQTKIVENLSKLEHFKQKVRDNIARKEEEARIALKKKNMKIEEVRQMLGYHIHPKDEKFKEALEKKDGDEKKAAKAAKKQLKHQRMLDMLTKRDKKETSQKLMESQESTDIYGKPINEETSPESPSSPPVAEKLD